MTREGRRRPQMTGSLVLLTAFVAGAGACGESATGNEPSPAEHAPASSKAQQATPATAAPALAEPGAKALAGTLEAYLDLQEKLAGDDPAEARTAFATLGQRLAEAGDVPSTIREPLNTAAQKGAATDEVSAQRQVFDVLSEAVIAALEQLGNPLPGAVHLAHCPMAFDNRGARWVQRSEAIKNPYFGSEMLSCGSVDAVVASGHKLPGTPK